MYFINKLTILWCMFVFTCYATTDNNDKDAINCSYKIEENKNKNIQKTLLEPNKKTTVSITKLIDDYKQRGVIILPILIMAIIDFTLRCSYNVNNRTLIIFYLMQFIIADTISYAVDYFISENIDLYLLKILSLFLYSIYPLYSGAYILFDTTINSFSIIASLLTIIGIVDFIYIANKLLTKKEKMLNKNYDILPSIKQGITNIKTKINYVRNMSLTEY